MKPNTREATRPAGKYNFRPSDKGHYNGMVQFWNERDNELTDTQEAELHLEIETAMNEHDALKAVAEAMPLMLREFNQHVADECRCPKVKVAADMASQALAALAAVRESEVKP